MSAGWKASDLRVLPRSAQVHAVGVQLGFEGVGGFGLDGLDLDLRHFDALRPGGNKENDHGEVHREWST